MITVGMYYDVVAGKEPDFEARFHDVLAALRRDPAHVRTELYRRVGEGGGYAILSEWKSREAFRGFLRSDLFREVAGWGRSGILQSRPRHEIYGDREEV